MCISLFKCISLPYLTDSYGNIAHVDITWISEFEPEYITTLGLFTAIYAPKESWKFHRNFQSAHAITLDILGNLDKEMNNQKPIVIIAL